jgi:GTP-binding protein HflX
MRSENAIIVGAGEERYLDELGRLAATLGVEVVGRLEQNRRDGTGYLGRGKRRELSEFVNGAGASLVITDDELTASQARVLERDCGADVVDRTELIIRIFELHARDAASRLQVELADLEYRLPRVKGRNPALSRLGGGVATGGATRGPGEQQLEYDRRAIRRRIEVIDRKLEQETRARAVRGARLREEGPPTVALVGYTNAGKTTILNSLSGAGRSTADRLFETLETTARVVPGKTDGASRPDFVVVDTVGFIRKLPTQLVHSFAGTLEAARDADIKVLCADASSPTLQDEIETAHHTLAGMVEDPSGKGLGDIQKGSANILCLNKADLLSPEELADLRLDYPEAVFISARRDITPLLNAVHNSIASDMERVEVLIPHSDYGAATQLYGRAEIHASENTTDGLRMDVTLPKSTSRKYAHYRV